MKKFVIILCLFTAVVLMNTGCGQKLPEGMPPLYPVKVIVKYDDGSTVAGATVLLISEETAMTGSWSTGGTTLEDGTIDLMTHGSYRGAPAGNYKVTVKCNVTEIGEPNPEGLDPELYEKLKARREEIISNPDAGGDMVTNYSLVESLYGSIANTPLRIKVEPVKNQTIELAVGERIKELL